MCGIVGTAFFDPNRPVSEATLRAMTRVLRHRGPDDEGTWIDRNIGLGFRRLSIIDLSNAANQPVPNEDGSVLVVLNGEIYNFRELREVLAKKGHRFRSRSDSEVVVHAYEEYGERCVKFLKGMFGLAIVDTRKRQVILARDRLGIKPLYYRVSSEGLWFASELKALRMDTSVERRIDPFALNLFMVQEVIPAPYTVYEGIQKLRPGEMLTVRLDQGASSVRLRRYWELRFETDWDQSEEQWEEALREKLEEVVASHMVSDVPLGAFLSGGLDSSSIVSFMSRVSKMPVESFTVRFEDAAYDEGQAAREVAKFYRTRHHELTVKIDSLEALDKLVWHYDEPFGDSSAIPTYFVSKLARQFVTVILSGDGGDELFGGYFTPRTVLKVRHVRRIPGGLRNLAAGAAMALGMSGLGSLKRLALPDWLMLVSLRSHIYDERHVSALQADWRRSWDEILAFYDPLREVVAGLPPLNVVSAAYFHLYLPNDILTKVDIASSAHSLETRVPFLSHDLVELAARIPPQLKFRGKNSKYIFRKAMRHLLPNVVFKHGKQGFSVPAESWSKSSWLRRLRELIDAYPVIEEVINCEGKEEWSPTQIWQILVLATFLRNELGS
jgi:asparagine synthase (glutamine-hydrolysing)